jgi:uncharacterized protein with FMN-binding domain
MPIALIAGVVIVIIGAVGFVITRDASTPEEVTAVEESLPTNDGPEPMPEAPVDEGGLSVEAEMADSLPAPEMDPTDPAVSGMNDMVVEDGAIETVGYADGVYDATASYFTPNNTEHVIDVSLTIADGVVAGVEVVYDGSSAKTPNHSRFDAAVAGDVVGVPLDDVQLSRTGGASLTSEAFNEAVDTIKQDAAA